jgi:predicted dienelactone hydrolase
MLIRFAVAIVVPVSLFAAAVADEARGPYKVGLTVRRLVPDEPYEWRGAPTHALVTAIWYPADGNAQEQSQWIRPQNPIASAGVAADDGVLAVAPVRFPLVLVSHGTGGTAWGMAWLGTVLASHGYVVAAVNHPGNTGIEDYTPQGEFNFWERARDVSVVIDRLLVDPIFGSRIDPQRIAGAGFSRGGYTMVELAGGISDLSLLEPTCAADADPTCGGLLEPRRAAERAELIRTDPAFRASVAHASDSYRDSRIRAVFVMAPGLGPILTPESLHKIAIPVGIVVGANDKVVTTAPAHKLATFVPYAELTIFPGSVGHFVFFDVCTDVGHREEPEACVDAPGVDRAAVHRQTIDLAVAFFAAALK